MRWALFLQKGGTRGIWTKLLYLNGIKYWTRGRKFLYSIEDSGLYEIDDKIEQILALSGHTINELFIKLVKEKYGSWGNK